MLNNSNVTKFDDFADLVTLENLPFYVLFYVIVFGAASVVGTIGNILVIVTMALTKKLRQSQNAFIASLSTADLMVSSVTMPASISGVLLGKHFYDQQFGLCAFTATVCAPGCVASMHSIAWIAISRYYYIGRYSDYVKYFTSRRITIYVVGIWLLGFITHVPNHLGWGQTRYSFMLRYCSLDTDLLSYALFYSFVLLAAIFMAFVFYAKIYNVLRHSTLSKKMISKSNQKSHQQDGASTVGSEDKNHSSNALISEIKIIKTSFKIFVLFLITWSPLCVLFLINVGDKVPPWLYLYCALLAHCNSTLNFVVYFVENDTFRQSLKILISKCCLKIGVNNKIFAVQQTMVTRSNIRSMSIKD